MAIQIPAAVWQFVMVGAQALFTRAFLLVERGTTKEEIEAHIAEMEAVLATAKVELERLRQQNP